MIKIFERYKEYLTKTLLVFVIFTVGFAFGKHSVKVSSPDSGGNQNATQSLSSDKGLVRLYYMHAMFRCVTCNKIEEMAKQLTQKEFDAELSSNKIEWKEVNFQQNQELAKKFDVVSSCVVVAVVKNGQIKSFERLDQVWTLLEKPEEFNAYLRNAIRNALAKLSAEEGA
ncbi:MAG: nitrophenyl compound nitroreductase subunit ArsF family protein [Candidatus Rifleibacteriota bacterium]